MAGKTFTIEVEVVEKFRVRPLMAVNRMEAIPARVQELLGRLDTYEAAVSAGTMLLALTDCEGFTIDKSFHRKDTVVVDGAPMLDDSDIRPATLVVDTTTILPRGGRFSDSGAERAWTGTVNG